eukprot:COSAG06_NODE_1291_length_9980_cov_166.860237_5_plen_109_part_00
MRSRVEEFGRIILSDAEASTLVHTKAVHVFLLTTTTILAIHPKIVGFPKNQLVTFFAFLVGGIAEVFTRGTAPIATKEKVKSACSVCGGWLAGMILFFFLFIGPVLFF